MKPLITAVGVISLSSATAALCTGGGLSISLQVASVFTGLGYCYYERNPFRVLRDLNTRILKLEDAKSALTQECENLNESKLAHASLNELEQLIKQKHQELQEVEKQYRKQWQQKEDDIAQRQGQIEKFLEEELQKLRTQADERSQALEQREAWINSQVEKLETELDEDKQNFLREQQAVIDQLNDEIDLLRSQLKEAEHEIKRYEFPRMPEGVEREDIAARRVIEILRDCKVVVDFRGAWIESGFIIVRIRPRRGGEREVKKWANRIHIELNLSAPPEVSTAHGAVQLKLKPQELVYLPASNEPTPSPDKPDGDTDESPETFIEPSIVLDPYGPIRPLESRWVLFLWNYHNPPIRNKKNVIRRVWGATNGARPEKFRAARERLHQILDDAGIKYRVRKVS